MLTADTITDEQIRELKEGLLVHDADAADVFLRCQDALGNFDQERMTPDAIGHRIDHARAHCAEILNERAKL